MLRPVLVLLLVASSATLALECYQETNYNGQNSNRATVSCAYGWCVKISGNLNGQKGTVRGCAGDLPGDICGGIGNKCSDIGLVGYGDVNVCCCNSNKCNGVMASKLALGGLSLVVACLFL
ncbi:hypothetical protein L596_009921 [Steinernema carpocapsae]|uniref:UPAR/Ly6 domain-containing protein n=1 Tax=Steinernema carpocapsae TaxID=34508 RepID=A0A4U5PH24_STECR|nr:hypothetical protein L596_009921 [Steinernema carpocapsae]